MYEREKEMGSQHNGDDRVACVAMRVGATYLRLSKEKQICHHQLRHEVTVNHVCVCVCVQKLQF